MRDPYKTLKVNRSATAEEIQAAYRSLAKKYHPDRNPGNTLAVNRFKQIQAAYELLRDPDRRRRFDETGDTSETKPDMEHAESVSRIVECLKMVLRRFAGAGENIARIDLVGEMRAGMEVGRNAVADQVRTMGRMKADLEVAAERFAVLDGESENVLRAVTLQQLELVAAGLVNAEKELAAIERAIDHLKRYGYTVDAGRGVKGVMTVTSMGLPHLIVQSSSS